MKGLAIGGVAFAAIVSSLGASERGARSGERGSSVSEGRDAGTPSQQPSLAQGAPTAEPNQITGTGGTAGTFGTGGSGGTFGTGGTGGSGGTGGTGGGTGGTGGATGGTFGTGGMGGVR